MKALTKVGAFCYAMKRQKSDSKTLQSRITRANEERAARLKEKNDYDNTYRKSMFFRSSYIIRVIMVVFSCYFYLFDDIVFFPSTEIITSCKVEKEIIEIKRSKYVNVFVYIQTNKKNNYNLDITASDGGSETFYKGDSIEIKRTLLGKPSYLSITGGAISYILTKHLYYKQFFLFIGIANLLSMFLIGGYEKASRYFVRFATFAGPVSLVIYLLI